MLIFFTSLVRYLFCLVIIKYLYNIISKLKIIKRYSLRSATQEKLHQKYTPKINLLPNLESLFNENLMKWLKSNNQQQHINNFTVGFVCTN